MSYFAVNLTMFMIRHAAPVESYVWNSKSQDYIKLFTLFIILIFHFEFIPLKLQVIIFVCNISEICKRGDKYLES